MLLPLNTSSASAVAQRIAFPSSQFPSRSRGGRERVGADETHATGEIEPSFLKPENIIIANQHF